MSPMLRAELVELGLSVPTDALTKWASDQLAAATGRETRLEVRGIGAAQLKELRHLIETVGRGHLEQGENAALPPPAGALAERIRIEALAWWQEAKRMARVAFSTDPDLLAKFRTGVQTGLLITNLTKELESMIVLLREHADGVSRLGATPEFLARGEALVARLKTVKVDLDAACRELPPTALQQFHDKGLLYDRTRALVRVGRLEFHLDPTQASKFNFTLVRRNLGASRRPRQENSRSKGR